ncbi:merozoite surface protein CMZ-8-like [Procambarus clarkii]|uniref:merozoite surface protein CMZ-8-like n=1 Tax=Procambarus clarkii TaxID=6728 RepID=UPI003742D79B
MTVPCIRPEQQAVHRITQISPNRPKTTQIVLALHILSADAHPVQPATDSATSLHTATTPDEPSTSPVIPETTPTSPETTPAAPETTPASQVPTPDASANQHLFSDDDSTASIDVEAQSPSPSPATEESPRVSALYDQREKLTLGTPEYRRLSSNTQHKIIRNAC